MRMEITDWFSASHDPACRRMPGWPDSVCQTCRRVIQAIKDEKRTAACIACGDLIVEPEKRCKCKRTILNG